MPPIYTDTTIRTGIHDFKTNISKYIRALDSGDYEQLLVTSRGRVIGSFVTYKGAAKRKERAKFKELSGLLRGGEVTLKRLLDGSLDAQIDG
jgi:antitoxin (DNA-binding transcriptional repressor) of toxin-antitoxin stability system